LACPLMATAGGLEAESRGLTELKTQGSEVGDTQVAGACRAGSERREMHRERIPETCSRAPLCWPPSVHV
jgi:hypothetical protein